MMSSSLSPGEISSGPDFPHLNSHSSDDLSAHPSPASDSPYPHLIQSTYAIPLQLELAFINTHVCNLHTEVADIETETAEMERRMTHLKERRNQLMTEINLYKGMSSPLRRFPAELLIKIFKSIPQRRLVSRSQCPISNDPWILAAVCKRWRDIVLSTPALWSSLAVNFRTNYSHMNRCKPSTWNNIIRNYLDHSANADLYITVSNHPYNPDSYTTDTITDVLSEYSHRFRGLELNLTSFKELAAQSLPRLQHLVLYRSKDSHGIRWSIVPKVVPNRWPNLKCLTMDPGAWDDIPANAAQDAFPWERLTCLSLWVGENNHDYLVPVMEKLSLTLVSLDIRIPPSKDLDAAWAGHQICMQRLQSLTMFPESDSIRRFRNMLTTPSLCSLHTTAPNDYDTSTDNLITRSSGSSPYMSSLRIYFGRHSYYDLRLSIFHNATIRNSLRELELDLPGMTPVDAVHLLETLMEDPILSKEPPFLSIETLTLRFDYACVLKFGDAEKLQITSGKRLFSCEDGGVKVVKLRLGYLTTRQAFEPGPERLQEIADVFKARGLEVWIIMDENHQRCPSDPMSYQWW